MPPLSQGNVTPWTEDFSKLKTLNMGEPPVLHGDPMGPMGGGGLPPGLPPAPIGDPRAAMGGGEPPPVGDPMGPMGIATGTTPAAPATSAGPMVTRPTGPTTAPGMRRGGRRPSMQALGGRRR